MYTRRGTVFRRSTIRVHDGRSCRKKGCDSLSGILSVFHGPLSPFLNHAMNENFRRSIVIWGGQFGVSSFPLSVADFRRSILPGLNRLLAFHSQNNYGVDNFRRSINPIGADFRRSILRHWCRLSAFHSYKRYRLCQHECTQYGNMDEFLSTISLSKKRTFP